jgi:hypothetical protein
MAALRALPELVAVGFALRLGRARAFGHRVRVLVGLLVVLLSGSSFCLSSCGVAGAGANTTSGEAAAMPTRAAVVRLEPRRKLLRSSLASSLFRISSYIPPSGHTQYKCVERAEA